MIVPAKAIAKEEGLG